MPRRSRALPLLSAVALLGAPAVAARAQTRSDDCPSGMVRVEGGRLQTAEADGYRVPSFCLDRTEVTVEAYESCVEVGACNAEGLDCGAAATWGRRKLRSHPVNCVTWAEADTYCREHGKRLPAEEEWEWAARGGRRAHVYPWGDDPPEDRVCWDGEGNTKGKGERKGTCPVAAHPRSRSADGIQDLAGNVREWTSTEHERFRVLRGGSWGDTRPDFLAAAFRGWNAPDERMELLGFRCAAPLGAVARKPTPRVEATAETDEAGVMIFSEPIELSPKEKKGKKRK